MSYGRNQEMTLSDLKEQINNNLPPLTKPMDFIKIANLELKYQGLLKNYS